MFKTLFTAAATVSAVSLTTADCQDCFLNEMQSKNDDYYKAQVAAAEAAAEAAANAIAEAAAEAAAEESLNTVTTEVVTDSTNTIDLTQYDTVVVPANA